MCTCQCKLFVLWIDNKANKFPQPENNNDLLPRAGDRVGYPSPPGGNDNLLLQGGDKFDILSLPGGNKLSLPRAGDENDNLSPPGGNKEALLQAGVHSIFGLFGHCYLLFCFSHFFISFEETNHPV